MFRARELLPVCMMYAEVTDERWSQKLYVCRSGSLARVMNLEPTATNEFPGSRFQTSKMLCEPVPRLYS